MEDTELFTKLLGLQPPWRVTQVQVRLATERIDVWVEEAPGSKFPCAGCGTPAPVYDHTEEQLWRHLDTCQCQTYVHARLPRTTCPTDGVRQVPAPWAEARSQFTRGFECRMIDTLKECDVSGGMRLLGTRWEPTWGVLERAVARGLARKARRLPTRLGIDEKAIRKGHHYETLVVDLDTSTVEAVLDERTQASLEAYYRQFTPEELARLEAIAMDMWEPYILATHACVPEAVKKIVFDKYHATRYVTEAVDKIRRQEHKVLQAENDARLKGTKHL
jgi:transposase